MPVVELRKFADQRITGLADLAEETHPARLRTQVADEVAFEFGVSLVQRPDRHFAPIEQGHHRFWDVRRGSQGRDVGASIGAGGRRLMTTHLSRCAHGMYLTLI